MRVSRKNDGLQDEDKAQVRTYEYDRACLRVGIVHFGTSSFYRSHAAEYIDDLIHARGGELGICMVGVMPADAERVDALNAQGCEYTRIIRHPDGSSSVRRIGAVVEALHAARDPDLVLERLTDPTVHTVTLTVTEGGYPYDSDTAQLTLSREQSLGALSGEYLPAAVFGHIIEALRRRRNQGEAPFAVLSCDNVPGNGDVTANVLAGLARTVDEDLADWIDRNVECPNSMVDRITPATTGQDSHRLLAEFGVRDAWPAVCEPYRQWVIEEDGLPEALALAAIGVDVVPDVSPFESAKLRLLNGGHQFLAHLGLVLGHTYVHEAVCDPAVREPLREYMQSEVIPTLIEVPGLDLLAYQETLLDRFANPVIQDPLIRICTDASDRIPPWVVPVIAENLECGRQFTYGLMLLATWRHSRLRQQGTAVPDRRGEWLADAALDPVTFLQSQMLLGALPSRPGVMALFAAMCQAHESQGPRVAYARVVNGQFA